MGVQMKRLSILPFVCFITCLASTIFLLGADSKAVENGIETKIEISATINKDPLGIKFKINDYGSAFISLTNNSSENLTIGDDMFISTDANIGFNVALIMPSHNSIPADQLSNYVYACGVNNFSKMKKDGILFAFGPGGDWINLGGVEKTYEGIWPKDLLSGDKVTIKHRFATWPGANQGWLATPIFTSSNGTSFRILAQFGKRENQQRILVPLDSENLEKLIGNDKLPVALRIWAACWLASSKSDNQWMILEKFISNEKINMELRKAVAKSLSTQAPAKALNSVNDVLWNSSTPEELQLICYYSFTWSKHSEAKQFIEKAMKHPNKKIRDEAEKYLSKQK